MPKTNPFFLTLRYCSRRPTLRDDKDKLRANLPQPGVKDDAELANQAVAD